MWNLKRSGQNLKKLTDLYIGNNYLDKIDNLNFIGIDNLQLFDLSFNQIKYFSRTFFANVRIMGYLYLSNNGLKKIESKAFEKVTNLNTALLYL